MSASLSDDAFGPTDPRVLQLVEIVSTETHVPASDILGRSHQPRHVRARHQLCVLLFRDGYGVAEVGRALRMNHTTIITALCKTLGPEYAATIRERHPGLAKAVEARRARRGAP